MSLNPRQQTPMDANQPQVIVLTTSNLIQYMDPAFLDRAGTTHFHCPYNPSSLIPVA